MTSLKDFESFLKKKNLKIKKTSLSLKYNSIKNIKIGKEKLTPLGVCNFKDNIDNVNFYYLSQLSPENFNFLLSIDDKSLILTNESYLEDAFTGCSAILNVKNLPSTKNFKIELKTVTIKRNINLVYTEIGYGSYFINLLFPVKENKFNQNILQIFKSLIGKFLNIGYIRGFRIRLISFQYKYINDISFLLSKFKENTKLNLFIDEGFLLDKLVIVYKYNSKVLIDDYLLQKLTSIENKINPEIQFISKNSFDVIENSAKFLWLYPYEKEFDYLLLDDYQLMTISSNIYSLIKFLRKYLLE